MKNILLLLLCVAPSICCCAQTTDDVGKITLSVVVPAEMDGLTQAQITNLQAKCLQIATAKHVSAAGYNSSFSIVPKLAINNTQVADGGMQNITVVTAELSLFVQQVETNTVFASISKKLTGSGTTLTAAISNAIANISANDPMFDQFFETAKQKIIKYYESRCNDIMQRAEVMVKKNDYEDAISTLMSIPEEVTDCYNKAQKRSIAIYKAYEGKMCEKQLKDARIDLAANNYEDALNALRSVDPECKCSKEAAELIKATASRVAAEKKNEWDMALKVYEDQVGLEKYYIDAVKEVTVAERRHKRN